MLRKIFSAAGLLAIANGQLSIDNANLSCDLDQNITFQFESSNDALIRKATVGDSSDCAFTITQDNTTNFHYVDNTGTKSYTLTASGSCLSDDQAPATSKSAQVKLYFSASPDRDIFIGNTSQQLTCHMKRTASVWYDFTSITLASETATDEDHGQSVDFTIKRQNDGNFNSENTSKDVTSGEQLYFLIKATDPQTHLSGIQYEVEECRITKTGSTPYRLFDLYDEFYCIEEFLDTTIVKNTTDGHADIGSWKLSYKAFTFDGVSEVADAVTLTCDLILCNNNDTETDGGFCKKQNVSMPCASSVAPVQQTPVVTSVSGGSYGSTGGAYTVWSGLRTRDCVVEDNTTYALADNGASGQRSDVMSAMASDSPWPLTLESATIDTVVDDETGGCANYNIRWRKQSDITRGRQWFGFDESFLGRGIVYINFRIKFIGSVPQSSTGWPVHLNIYGEVSIDWLDHVTADQWHEVSIQKEMPWSAESPFIIFIFDGVAAEMEVLLNDLRVTTQ